ncbi:MAG: hypothetical protein ACRDD1_20640, partial [Planctomycetia bacterium]
MTTRRRNTLVATSVGLAAALTGCSVTSATNESGGGCTVCQRPKMMNKLLSKFGGGGSTAFTGEMISGEPVIVETSPLGDGSSYFPNEGEVVGPQGAMQGFEQFSAQPGVSFPPEFQNAFPGGVEPLVQVPTLNKPPVEQRLTGSMPALPVIPPISSSDAALRAKPETPAVPKKTPALVPGGIDFDVTTMRPSAAVGDKVSVQI